MWKRNKRHWMIMMRRLLSSLIGCSNLFQSQKEGHSSSSISDPSKPLHVLLGRIEKRIGMVSETTKSLSPGPGLGHCLLVQLEEEIVALKAELADTGHGIALLETGGQELLGTVAALNKALFDLGLHI